MTRRPSPLAVVLASVLAHAPLMTAAAGQGASGTPLLAGRVFLDLDGDGRWREGEPGVAGVVVSDGGRWGRSAEDGRYTLAAGSGPREPLFVVKPPAYALARRPDGLPDAWRPAGTSSWDIPLREAPQAMPYEVRLFGDPQAKNEADVGFFRRDIVESELALPRARLGLSLGDIVHSNLALYPAMVRATAAMRTPWLHVSGNHDRDHGAGSDEGSLATFRRFFGPDTFAWEEPGMALVVLDNTVHEPGSGVPARYVGGLREAQFRFLEAYLAMLPADRLLLVAMHIPLFDTNPDPAVDSFRDADRQRLYRLLAVHPRVLLLSSHTHQQQHRWHGAAEGWPGTEPLHEYNVGAACGAFWSGVRDGRGIPDARMADGTPNGFATLAVRAGGAYDLRWHVAGDSHDPPFALHAPRVLRRGAWPGFGLYANVWMGDAGTRVEYRVGEGAWQPMRRVDRPDPALAAINADDDRADALRAYDRAPEAVDSPHLWRGTLPTDLPAGEHVVEVRVFDRWRGELRRSLSYRLDDASP
ncbi:MAG: calcineurin-like phosphoesterase C-terminal domain-containing protein [Lysobacteraceae bacterium]